MCRIGYTIDDFLFSFRKYAQNYISYQEVIQHLILVSSNKLWDFSQLQIL